MAIKATKAKKKVKFSAVKLKSKKRISRKVQEKLVEDYKPMVIHIAKRYQFREDLEDLIQIGMIGLMKAAKRFDEKFKVKFSTYAVPNIEGEIRHYVRDKSSSVKISRKLIELNAKANRMRIDHLQTYGKEPSTQKIAKTLGVTEIKLLKAMSAVTNHFTVSLDEPLHSLKGSSSKVSSLDDIVGGESFVNNVIDREGIKFALKKLNPREQEVIYLHFFCDEKQEKLAKRFEVTQAQISRIISSSLKKMERVLAA